MGKHIFICHSTLDKLVAEKVREALESRDIQCWMAPQDIPPGAEWAEAIVDAVDNSSGVVLILSSNSNSSPQVIREIGRAVSKNVSIIPFRIDDTPLSRSMEYFLSTHQWLDALEPPLEKHFPKLADTVQRLLDREAAKEEARREAEAARARREAEKASKAQEAARAKKKAKEAAKEKARQEAEVARARQEVAKAREKAEEAAKERERWEAEVAQARRELARTKKKAEEARKARGAGRREEGEDRERAKEKARQEAEAKKAREAEERAEREAEEARKAQEAAKAKKEARERAKKEAEKAAKEREKREAKEAKERAKEKARQEAEVARARQEVAKAREKAEEAAKERERWEAEVAQARRELARTKKKAEEARKARGAGRREEGEDRERAKEKARQEAEVAQARRELARAKKEAEEARKAARVAVPAGAGKRITKSVWLWAVVALLLVGLGIFTIPLLTTEQPPPTPTSPGTDFEPGPVLDVMTPVLQWSSVPDADYYALTISKCPYGPDDIIYYKRVTGTPHYVLRGTLAGGEKYCWNVQAHGPGGLSGVSDTLYFQIPSPILSGYIRTAGTNVPISGASITLWDYSSLQTLSWIWCSAFTTDDEGYYAIFALSPGTYALRVEAEGRASKWFSNTYAKDEATPLLITDASGKVANFTLEVGGSISGKVITDAGGSDIYNMHVYAEDYRTCEWIAGVFTGIDGTYTMSGLPKGTYRVGAVPWVKDQPYVVEWYDNTTNYHSAEQVTVNAGQDTPGINFSLASTAP